MTTGFLCVRLAVIAQDGVLLPLPLRIQGAERVTIDLARATVPGSPPSAALPLHPPWARSRQKIGVCATGRRQRLTVQGPRIVKIFKPAFPREITPLPSSALRLVFCSPLIDTHRQ
jgi:hypothetical protein